MSFPQFYLHYNTKEDLTVKVDRAEKPDGLFNIAIPIEEELTKRLLSGEINESNLIVNKFADPPYVIDKALFPKDATFFIIFNLDTLKIIKVSAKKPEAEQLQTDRCGSAVVDNRVAYSILAGDTTFADWEVASDDVGQTIVKYSPASDGKGSSLFKNRVDFLSLAEISITTPKLAEKSLPKLCTFSVDYIDNSITIVCSSLPEEHFADFFLAVTNKNDPSYLIKTFEFEPNKTLTLEFSGRKLEEMSFFTSRFHLLNTQVEVTNCFTGSVKIFLKNGKVVITNNLDFTNDLPEVIIILKNKYDSSQVYRTLKLRNNDPLTFSNKKINLDDVEVEALHISKKFITIFR